MVIIKCKKCGEISYISAETLGDVTDFESRDVTLECRNCNKINRITLEDDEPLPRKSWLGK
jgi:RNase P subunit RPR2